MASHQLIEQYVADLRRELPAGTADELADGLAETVQHQLSSGLTEDQAARTAIAEFGTARQVVDAFVASASGRRTARLLLATGPAIGMCWGASLVMTAAWTWPVPRIAAVVFGVGLLGVVGCLAIAATSRHSYRRTHLGNLGALTMAVLDAVMLVTVLLISPPLVWPMAIAVAASVARLGFAANSVPRHRFLTAR